MGEILAKGRMEITDVPQYYIALQCSLVNLISWSELYYSSSLSPQKLISLRTKSWDYNFNGRKHILRLSVWFIIMKQVLALSSCRIVPLVPRSMIIFALVTYAHRSLYLNPYTTPLLLLLPTISEMFCCCCWRTLHGGYIVAREHVIVFLLLIKQQSSYQCLTFPYADCCTSPKSRRLFSNSLFRII